MNFYQSTFIIFTILFIVVMLFVYYLFVSKKTSIKSKYDSCPDYWTMDPATGFCNPLRSAFINYGLPKDTNAITDSNILDLVSAETRGNVIEGNTTASCTVTQDTTGHHYIDMNGSVFRLKIKKVDCNEITLVFAIKTTNNTNFDLMTAYNYPSNGAYSYSYYIIGTSTSFAITTQNDGTPVTYTTSSITFAASTNYVITVYLKRSYTASEYIKFNVNGTAYTTNAAGASVFNFNNEYIAFGNYSGGINTATTYPYNLYKFVQLNYGYSTPGTVYGTVNDISNASGFMMNFNDPKWYSDYNSQSLECSWQQWCRKNNIQWSGITNGTFC